MSKILATGDDGSFSDFKIIIESTDGGLTWAKVTTALSDSGWSVVWSEALGIWVNGTDLASMTDQVQTSPDAVTWTALSTPADFRGVRKFATSPGIIVSVAKIFGGSGGPVSIMTSTDGITWTEQPIPATVNTINAAASVAYSPDLGLFVIADVEPASSVGGVGGVITSPDGITWTLHHKQSNMPTRCAAWGNGIFVLMGGPQGSGEHLYTSTDGITWTQHLTNPGGSPMSWADVTFGDGVFVAVSDDTVTNPGNQAAHSADGITWTLAATPGATKHWSAVAYDGAAWVAGNSGTNSTQPLMRSTNDGASWSLITLGFSYGFINGIASDFVPTPPTVVAGNIWGGGSGQNPGNHW